MNQAIYTDFANATLRLREALETSPSKMTRDSAILRFQLCFDLAWKSIKKFAQAEGVECYSPKSCFMAAFQIGLIEHDDIWIDMINDRNTVVHVYQEKLADTLYKKLPEYLTRFQELSEKLQPKPQE